MPGTNTATGPVNVKSVVATVAGRALVEAVIIPPKNVGKELETPPAPNKFPSRLTALLFELFM